MNSITWARGSMLAAHPVGAASVRWTAGVARGRLIQTLCYELIGILAIAPLYRAVTGSALYESLTLLACVSVVAALWCCTFNAAFDQFDAWAAQRDACDRPHRVRWLQSALRELAEVPLTLPVIHALGGADLTRAFQIDLALAGVYAIYGFAFFLIADKLNSRWGALGVPAGVRNRHRIFWRTPTGVFSVTLPINGKPATPGSGSTIGFACQSAEQVDAWHAAGVAHGGSACEDPPRVREGASGKLYLAYLRDSDGNKIWGLYRVPRG